MLSALWLCGALTLASHADEGGGLARYARAEAHMGVEFEVVLYAGDAQRADEAIGKAMARIAELDQTLSDYDLESELSKLSATAAVQGHGDGPFAAVQVSDDLWRVLAQSQAISEASGGAFDVTVGQLTRLWRRARRWKELPEVESLAAARAAMGYRNLRLDRAHHTAQLLKANVRLDLGGIAKGYAADEALAAIKACGISRALVRASGDIVVGEPPPGERGWRIGIAPLEADEPPSRFVLLANCAISTSGDARQHLVVEGRRYSHVLDPRTGQPVEGRSSVTVIGPAATLTDAIATAASVLGAEQAVEFVRKFEGAELLMVWEDVAGRERLSKSDGFERYLVP